MASTHALTRLVASLVAATSAFAQPAAPPPRPFAIRVVDAATRRGVPLVELRTVHNVCYVTDSQGMVAFAEPGLVGERVYFHVRSHGYTYPEDRFGNRGVALDVVAGGKVEIEVARRNIAERLYRVTGAGIYRDSVLLGLPVPIANPLLNAQVAGSDSVMSAVYRGDVYWFWGDTSRLSYPLGNFHVAGATSALPGRGGLDPGVGVDLRYFTNDEGFAREMARVPGEGPTWIDGLAVLRDADGRERLLCAYAKVRPPMEVYERGTLLYDDELERFTDPRRFPVDAGARPRGHAFLHREDGVQWLYFADPLPLVRVRADAESYRDIDAYETYTCLRPSTGELDRDADGDLQWQWRRGGTVVDPAKQRELIEKGELRPGEARFQLQDAATGDAVLAHRGSVAWNDFRRRFVLIAVESAGTSMLGEVWLAEADTPLGPWRYACKVATHERYSFYNPKHHAFFDQDGGRTIYFEGTYSHTFSGNDQPTPRYDYNQILYRLDLADPRTWLPVPIYRDARGQLGTVHAALDGERELVFFAQDRALPGCVPIYASADGAELLADPHPAPSSSPLFFALAPDVDPRPPTAIPLRDTGAWVWRATRSP